MTVAKAKLAATFLLVGLSLLVDNPVNARHLIAAESTPIMVDATAADSQHPDTVVRTFKLEGLRLYQPERVLAPRIDVASLAKSAKDVQRSFERLTAGAWVPEVKGVLVAVAIRPGGRHRVWCELVGKEAPAEAAKLEVELNKTVMPDATGATGLVAYALEFVREGEAPSLPMIPMSWQAVAKQAGKTIKIPDDAVDALWPESPN